MKKIASRTEILGSFDRDGRQFEVCAISEANFDEEHSRLVMDLDSFVRPVDIRVKEEHLQPDWLPRKRHLTESVSMEDAQDMAKEIFHGWVAKTRQCITFPIHH
jgi:hypothetical protein